MSNVLDGVKIKVTHSKGLNNNQSLSGFFHTWIITQWVRREPLNNGELRWSIHSCCCWEQWSDGVESLRKFLKEKKWIGFRFWSFEEVDVYSTTLSILREVLLSFLTFSLDQLAEWKRETPRHDHFAISSLCPVLFNFLLNDVKARALKIA